MRKWTKQPPAGTQIDLSHPLARHITGYFNAAEGLRWNKGPQGVNTPTLALDGSHARAPFTGSPAGLALRGDDVSLDTHGALFTNGPEIPFTNGSPGATLLFGLTTESFTASARAYICHLASGSGHRFSVDASNILKWESSSTAFVSSTAHKLNDGGFHTAGFWFRDGGAGDTAGLVSDGVLLDTSTSHGNFFTDTTLGSLLDSGDSTGGDWNHDPGMPFAIVLKGVPGYDFPLQAYLELSANPWQIFKPPKNFALADPLPQTRVLNVPQVWTEQPPAGTQIDWGNPVTRGIVHAAVQGGSVNLRNSASPKGQLTGGGSPTVTTNKYGLALDDGWSTTGYDNVASFQTNEPYTLTALTTTGDTSTNDQNMHVISCDTTETNRYTGIVIRDNITTAANRYFRFAYRFTGSTSQYVESSITSRPPLTPVTVSGVQYSDTDRRLFEDGVQTGTSTASHTGTFTTKQYTVNDARRDGIDSIWGQQHTGSTALTIIHNRALSPEEIKALHDNPWQIFQTQDLQVPIEYEELTFDETKEERLFMIPQGATRQPR